MIENFLGKYKLNYIIVTGNKISFILFESDRSKFVIKLSKEDFLKERLGIIKFLQKNDLIKETVPKLIRQRIFNKHRVYIESCVDGQKMVPESNNFDSHIDLVTKWITKLNKIWSKNIDKKNIVQIEKSIKELWKYINLDQKEKYLKLIIKKLNESSKEIKIYIAHGDLACPNILIKNKSINIIELDEYIKTFPLFDFFNFIFTYYFYLWKKNNVRDDFFKFSEDAKNKDSVKKYLKIFDLEKNYYLFLSLFLIDRLVFYSKIKTTIPEDFIRILHTTFKELSLKKKFD